MHYFQRKKGKLYCENVAVSKLAKEYGTPLYVYSQRTIVEHYRKLAEAFAELDPIICYSVKANSNLAILKTMVSEGAGLDIVSGGELFRAKKVKCPMKKVVYASVGKTDPEITDAIKSGILFFNVESLPELERINMLSGKLGKKTSVALRVNPDVDAMTHEYITTAKKKAKFGIDLATAREILVKGQKKYKNLKLDGIHIHIGSQIVSGAPYVEALTKMKAFIDDVRAQGAVINYFDAGGGLGIIYNEEKPQTPKDFASQVKAILKSMNAKIIFEPGRFIVGNAGVLATAVSYVKESYEKQFVIVDAAMNDLIRPSLYSAFHSIEPADKEPQKELKKGQKVVDIVGPVCESGDFLGKERILDVKRDDIVAVMSAGAYGFTMSSNYNSRPRAAEVMVDGSKVTLIRKRETYADVIRNEVV
jgi:diaminopimelate decarboxylase